MNLLILWINASIKIFRYLLEKTVKWLKCLHLSVTLHSYWYFVHSNLTLWMYIIPYSCKYLINYLSWTNISSDNPAGMDASQIQLWDVSYSVSETLQRGLRSLRGLIKDVSSETTLRSLTRFSQRCLWVASETVNIDLLTEAICSSTYESLTFLPN